MAGRLPQGGCASPISKPARLWSSCRTAKPPEQILSGNVRTGILIIGMGLSGAMTAALADLGLSRDSVDRPASLPSPPREGATPVDIADLRDRREFDNRPGMADIIFMRNFAVIIPDRQGLSQPS
jgi:hypothetical protein